ncbi:uncharacterized protein L969DRAFT_92968 [Mixia osmundae IAM 14324]|uniref:Phospholipase/carboxylesterase/thioesterase domain-containing protein n=1 Tax=Mixia osmundae (strain CBS 9802 / IAM 14324 / JCM 22182 / KY 12970) TaxID=764103 RepID=G7DTX5_MIXOS|nr:uncharacterized protein L969DRAFT_92968 [Mixia osmundae IAM 14324]KEI41748.1 hypothetical protein L969DRAFT_92968 [Mixia osmundae IAM 14324]GAA94035.1 hypothetical protein E5Q_00682 [Mixia osmundae IAM 14324]
MNVEPAASSDDPRQRIPPDKILRTISPTLVHHYEPAQDGIDSNLLVMLHGLGDTQKPFSALGRKLNLPQTAVLSIQAPRKIVWLADEECYEWWQHFDVTGEVIIEQDPSKAIAWLCDIIDSLRTIWRSEHIHFFGFGQGGSLALETCRALSRVQLRLGSAVSIQAGLMSLPTAGSARSATPVLLWLAKTPVQADQSQFERSAVKLQTLPILHRAFESAELARVALQTGMPRSQADWLPIMRFWSQHLRRREAWELQLDESVFRVLR